MNALDPIDTRLLPSPRVQALGGPGPVNALEPTDLRLQSPRVQAVGAPCR